MEPDFDWPVRLRHRKGAPTNLEGIDVFYDFDWNDYFADGRMQFRNGKCLAEQALGDCPDGKTAALLLTEQDDKQEGSFESDLLFVLVINFPTYLELADANAAVSYLARNFGPGITNLGQLSELVGQRPEEIRAFLESQLTAERVGEWAAGKADRLAELRQVIDSDEGPHGDEPAPVAAVAAALHAIDDLDVEQVERLRAIFTDANAGQLVEFVSEHDILPKDLLNSLEHSRRVRAVAELEEMLSEDLTEAPWQVWFEENDWVLGTEFVRVLEERPIDTEHIADYLMEAYDGFLDLVEIKRPEGDLKFWASSRDHGNYVPHSDLIKAITQATRYILEVEREANSVKFLERIGGVKAIKPRCVVIYGRSSDWNVEMREAYRVLNASYHNLTIMTFDHVLTRAKRVLGIADDDLVSAV